MKHLPSEMKDLLQVLTERTLITGILENPCKSERAGCKAINLKSLLYFSKKTLIT